MFFTAHENYTLQSFFVIDSLNNYLKILKHFQIIIKKTVNFLFLNFILYIFIIYLFIYLIRLRFKTPILIIDRIDLKNFSVKIFLNF